MAPSSSQGLTDEASDEERQSDALKKYTESAPLATPLLGEDTGPMPLRERNGVAVACAAGAALGALVFGYVLGFSSPSLPGMIGRVFSDVTCSGKTAASATADLWSSIVNVGCMVGALAGARVLDACGRRGALIYVAGPLYAGAWLLTAKAHDSGTLIAARVVLGAGVGVCSVAVPVYIAETAPVSLRGALGAANQLAVTIGIFLVYLFGLLEPHASLSYACGAKQEGMARGAWRRLALVGAFLGGALSAVGSLLPESPVWLQRRGRSAAAADALRRLRGGDADRAAAELAKLADASNGGDDEGMSVSDVARALFSKSGDAAVRAPLLVAMVVMVCQQFSGINAVIFFSGTILNSAGMANQDLGGAIVMGIQVVATGISCLLMDRAGRRPLLIGSLGGMALAAGTMSLYFALRPACPPWVALGALVVYIVSFSLGLGPIPWLLMAEILPARARGVAASAATLLNWTCSFVVTETFADLVQWIEPAGAFLVFAGVCVAGCGYVLVAVPETKGLQLAEVEALFVARRSD